MQKRFIKRQKPWTGEEKVIATKRTSGSNERKRNLKGGKEDREPRDSRARGPRSITKRFTRRGRDQVEARRKGKRDA